MADDSGSSGMLGVLVGVLLVVGILFVGVQYFGGGSFLGGAKDVNVNVKVPGAE
ncbi:MAG: hypothetical protein AB7F41_05525 [Methylocystis sp.]|uniref:hypothetical protein n=1 Tax=Methylocystis sp. TaxID=1911079 RepID=UPI003D109F04